MKTKTFIFIGALCAALSFTSLAYPLLPSAADDDTAILLSQYLNDKDTGTGDRTKKETVQELLNKEMERPRPHFIMGVGGGADAREGFGSVMLTTSLGVLYDRFTVTIDPGFVYTNAKSITPKKGMTLENLTRAKMNGQIYEFNLPFKFTYSILDIARYPYTPYVMAGTGYSLWKFSLNESSFLSHMSRHYALNSMTLNFGFGFFVTVTEHTRFNVGLNGVSYFNTRSGDFNYDTTGVSLLFGMMQIFD
jgi:hypothetical protein